MTDVSPSCSVRELYKYIDSNVLHVCRPTPKYAPWFNVVLKCARLAVRLLQTLSEEVLFLSACFSSDLQVSLAATSVAM